MPAPRGETFLQKVSKELIAVASRRQSKGKSHEGHIDGASSLLAPRTREQRNVGSPSGRVRLSPALGNGEAELKSSAANGRKHLRRAELEMPTLQEHVKDTSSRTPKHTNGVARKALSVESDGGAGASHGRLKRKAMATKTVDRSEEAKRPHLDRSPGSQVCLMQVRDADLLEAWSRGETLVVEDDDEVEHFEQGDADNDVTVTDVTAMQRGSVLWQDSPRRTRRRIRKRLRLQESLLGGVIDADLEQEQQYLHNGERWFEKAVDVDQAWDEQDGDVCEEPEEEPEDLENLEELEEEVEYLPDEEVELEEGEEEPEAVDDVEVDVEEWDVEARELEAEVSNKEAGHVNGNAVASKRHQASFVPAADIAPNQDSKPRKRAKLVPEKSQAAPKVVRLRSRPQLVPAAPSEAGSKKATLPKQAHYIPPHEKRRHLELAKWKETKAAWHRKLQEEEALGNRPKQKMGPNIRALARRFEATLEKPGSCCLNPLQKDDCIEVSKDGLRAMCEPSASTGPSPSRAAFGGIKGLPLVAGGRYQFEVELRRGGSLTIGWSAALVLPSVLEGNGRSAACRMLGFSSDGELIGGEGPMRSVPAFGRPGDIVGALLDWPEDACGPRLAFMLNGRFLGVAFDFGREGISAPPLQPHICQGNGKAFSVLMRGAANQAPLRFPMRGFRPLGSVLERHFSPFSKAVELATAADDFGDRQLKPPPAAARRLIHSSLGLALPLPHLAQERACRTAPPAPCKVRVVTRQDDSGN